MVKKNEAETRKCQYKGCLPHLADPAYVLIWELPTGPVVKWSCADHRFRFGGNRPPVVAKVEHFEEEPCPTHSESGDEMCQWRLKNPRIWAFEISSVLAD